MWRRLPSVTSLIIQFALLPSRYFLSYLEIFFHKSDYTTVSLTARRSPAHVREFKLSPWCEWSLLSLLGCYAARNGISERFGATYRSHLYDILGLLDRWRWEQQILTEILVTYYQPTIRNIQKNEDLSPTCKTRWIRNSRVLISKYWCLGLHWPCGLRM